MSEDESVTAVDYINSQLELERQARELMPYSSDECTYEKGELRQPVFACLDCSKASNQPVGVCYSCSIQCHLTHEIVELFTKRNFVCDCGTTRMEGVRNGSCKLRLRPKTSENEPTTFKPRSGSVSSLSSRPRLGSSLSLSGIELPPEDIPSLSNNYNQNFKGVFCNCHKPYNPLDGNMIQCYFGFVCGEDWYHEECILGYKQGRFNTSSGKNLIEDLPHPEDDAETEQKTKIENKANENDDFDETQSKVPHFPNLDSFDSFICWKCVEKFPHIFKQLDIPDIVLTKLPFIEGVKSVEEWKSAFETFANNSSPKTDIDLATVDEKSHKRKLQEQESSNKRLNHEIPYSVFLKPGFRDHLAQLSSTTLDSKLSQFLKHNEYLYKDDPVYEPPEDDDDENSSSTGSLLELGADALLSLPPEQAIEGLHAYNKIREKLKDFFKPFAEQGELVTEEKVREFFDQVKNDKS